MLVLETMILHPISEGEGQWLAVWATRQGEAIFAVALRVSGAHFPAEGHQVPTLPEAEAQRLQHEMHKAMRWWTQERDASAGWDRTEFPHGIGVLDYPRHGVIDPSLVDTAALYLVNTSAGGPRPRGFVHVYLTRPPCTLGSLNGPLSHLVPWLRNAVLQPSSRSPAAA